MKAWEYRTIPFAQRVEMHICRAENGCHNFLGRKDGSGYGQIKDKGRAVLVHRWIWEQSRGPIPAGMNILHSCNNRSCVNVDHLRLGTHTDNMRDKVAAGNSKNMPRGAAHKRPMAKLNQKQVIEIKALLKRGYRQSDIATDYRVSRQIVSDIALRKTWGWLE